MYLHKPEVKVKIRDGNRSAINHLICLYSWGLIDCQNSRMAAVLRCVIHASQPVFRWITHVRDFSRRLFPDGHSRDRKCVCEDEICGGHGSQEHWLISDIAVERARHKDAVRDHRRSIPTRPKRFLARASSKRSIAHATRRAIRPLFGPRLFRRPPHLSECADRAHFEFILNVQSKLMKKLTMK